MAILGGAGNPVAGSFTGPAQALEYAGDLCYAYSGTIVVNDDTVTMFEFQSGSNLIKAKFSFGINLSAMYTSKFIGYIITLNDSIVMKSILDDNTQEGFDNDPCRLVLPPYTNVKIEAITDSATDNETYGVITGRVFRNTD
jgi:hypothetical protein